MDPTAAACKFSLVVESKEAVARDVVALSLRAVDKSQLPAWTPGAHIDLVLPGDVVRQYSLCGDWLDLSQYRLAVLREPHSRGGSSFIHDELAIGGYVSVRGPRNNFQLVESTRYIFIAGGIGITPILPMVAAAEEARAEWTLLYGGCTRKSMAFLEDLWQYGDRVLIKPQDEHGVLDIEAPLRLPRLATKVYCCGPESLVAAVQEQCRSLPPGSLHLERFRSAVQPQASRQFEVVLQRSGLTLNVPEDKSVLDVVEEAGLAVLSSCMEGSCGSCETEVLAGIPDHRDVVLGDRSREDGNMMMICVSRSRTSTLVLDL